MDWLPDREESTHPISGVVVRFPNVRERQQQDELSPEAVLCRVRFKARAAGCCGLHIACCEQRAKKLMADPLKARHEIIAECAQYARELARRPRGDGPEAA